MGKQSKTKSQGKRLEDTTTPRLQPGDPMPTPRFQMDATKGTRKVRRSVLFEMCGGRRKRRAKKEGA